VAFAPSMASVLCIHDRMRVDDSPDALHQHADAGQQAESHVIFNDYSSIGRRMSQALRTRERRQYAETATAFYPADTA